MKEVMKSLNKGVVQYHLAVSHDFLFGISSHIPVFIDCIVFNDGKFPRRNGWTGPIEPYPTDGSVPNTVMLYFRELPLPDRSECSGCINKVTWCLYHDPTPPDFWKALEN